MRTTTRRGLAAGAGAAAVLVAGAASALAIPGKPDAAFWEAYYAQQGYEDVSCAVSVVNGAPGVLDVVSREGIALAQGFGIGRPCTEDEFITRHLTAPSKER